MNKREITELTDSELIAHALRNEAQSTKEENTRGITNSTKKDYMWTMEELCKRFDLDIQVVTKKIGADHWWNFEKKDMEGYR